MPAVRAAHGENLDLTAENGYFGVKLKFDK